MSQGPIKKKDTLQYHQMPKPGKIEVVPTKPSNSQRDLSIAYSPGVADPCLEIAANPEDVYKYTAKGNLVAVISNGTAVLGLGDIGPEASKPVMEGKGVLFKIFADIDVFDLELDAADPDKFIDTVKAVAPTFGGINLEDIKAPDCFYIEKRLKEELDIPIMQTAAPFGTMQGPSWWCRPCPASRDMSGSPVATPAGSAMRSLALVLAFMLTRPCWPDSGIGIRAVKASSSACPSSNR